MPTTPTHDTSELRLSEIASINEPVQLSLMAEIGAVLAASNAVSHLLVRGSLASGTADRLSDLDFVVAVDDASYATFVSTLDDIMTVHSGVLLPGWYDSIVADFGGLGLVYLVPRGEKLHQIDLYLVPGSRLAQLRGQVGTAPLLDRGVRTHDRVARATAANFVEAIRARPRSCTQLVIEHLVLAVLLRKRIRRGQRFIAYDEWHLLNSATKNLVKAALAPSSSYWGWYQLEEEVARTPIGRACVAELDAALSAPAVPDARDIDAALGRALTIARRACPQALEGLEDAVRAYNTYMEAA